MINGLIAYHLASFWKRIIALVVIVLFLFLALSLFVSSEYAIFLSVLFATLLIESNRVISKFRSLGLLGGRVVAESFLLTVLLISFYILALFGVCLILGFKIQYFGVNNPGYFYRVFVLIIAMAVLEELVFRGIIYQALIQRFKWINVTVIMSLIFAFLHAFSDTYTLITFINIFLASVLLYSAYQMSGTLWLTVFWHAGWNLMLAVILDSSVSGFNFQVGLFEWSYPENIFFGTQNYGLESGLLTSIFLIVTNLLILKYVKAKPELIAFGINREYAEFLLIKKKKKN